VFRSKCTVSWHGRVGRRSSTRRASRWLAVLADPSPEGELRVAVGAPGGRFGFTNADAGVVFFVGGSTSTVIIDDVSLTEVP